MYYRDCAIWYTKFCFSAVICMAWSLPNWREHGSRLMYIGFVISITVMSSMYIQDRGAVVRKFSTDLLTGDLLDLHPRLSEVRDIGSFWDYMEFTLYPSVFYNELHGTESAGAEFPTVDVTNSTRLVGSIAVYTSRVVEDTECGVSVPFSDVFGHCFAEQLHPSSTNKTTYNGFVFSEILSPMSPIVGSAGQVYRIDEGGFVVELSSNVESMIESLRSDQFIESDRNRVIFVFLTLFHSNLGTFNSIRIQFEISEFAIWTNFVHSETVLAQMTTPLDEGSFLAAYVVSFTFWLVLIVVELLQFFVAQTRLQLLKTKWLLYVILLLSTVQLVYIATAPAFPVPTPLIFFNSWWYFWSRNWIVGISAVVVMLMFIELIVPLIQLRLNFFYFPISMLAFAAAFAVADGSRQFSEWVYFLSLSFVGVSAWSEEFSQIVAGILVALWLLTSRFVFIPYIFSQLILPYSLLKEEAASVVPATAPIAGSKFLERYAPGLYYRYIVSEAEFAKKVERQRAKRECALLPQTVQRSEEESNLYAIQMATEEVKEKLGGVVQGLETELRAVKAKLKELDKLVHTLAVYTV